jgi:hypothetical protein
VAIGGPMDGVLTAPASTLAFTKVSSVGALCLTWGKGGLYACASEFTDGFTAGISADQGKTWTPVFHLAGFCPLQCGASTGVATLCPAAWPPVQMLLNITSCGGDGGTASTASSSGGSTSGAGGSTKSNCSCSLPGAAGGMAAGAGGVALLALAAARRRRGRRAP